LVGVEGVEEGEEKKERGERFVVVVIGGSNAAGKKREKKKAKTPKKELTGVGEQADDGVSQEVERVCLEWRERE